MVVSFLYLIGTVVESWQGFNDIFWNTESIYKSLKKKKVAKVIAQAIADYIKEGE